MALVVDLCCFKIHFWQVDSVEVVQVSQWFSLQQIGSYSCGGTDCKLPLACSRSWNRVLVCWAVQRQWCKQQKKGCVWVGERRQQSLWCFTTCLSNQQWTKKLVWNRPAVFLTTFLPAFWGICAEEQGQCACLVWCTRNGGRVSSWSYFAPVFLRPVFNAMGGWLRCCSLDGGTDLDVSRFQLWLSCLFDVSWTCRLYETGSLLFVVLLSFVVSDFQISHSSPLTRWSGSVFGFFIFIGWISFGFPFNHWFWRSSFPPFLRFVAHVLIR